MLMSLSTGCAADPPATVAQLEANEHDWLASLGGLHAIYTITEPFLNPAIKRQFPHLNVTYTAIAETWVATDDARYRYETRLDQGSIAAAVTQLSSAAGGPVSPRRLYKTFDDSILVRSRSRSEYLDLGDGRLNVRWLPTSPNPLVPVPPLRAEDNMQPLLSGIITTILRPNGVDLSGRYSNPLTLPGPMPGVSFSQEQAKRIDTDHATLAFHVALSHATAEGQLEYHLSLARHGGADGRWLIERIQVDSPDTDGVSEVTTIAWRDLPGTHVGAAPERIVETALDDAPRVSQATTLEVLPSFPPRTWSVDPMLAKIMYDETAEMEIVPSP